MHPVITIFVSFSSTATNVEGPFLTYTLPIYQYIEGCLLLMTQ